MHRVVGVVEDVLHQGSRGNPTPITLMAPGETTETWRRASYHLVEGTAAGQGEAMEE